jgi:hypothetical protein
MREEEGWLEETRRIVNEGNSFSISASAFKEGETIWENDFPSSTIMGTARPVFTPPKKK